MREEERKKKKSEAPVTKKREPFSKASQILKDVAGERAVKTGPGLKLLCTEHAAKGANKREASRMERDRDVVRWRDSRRHGRGEVTARRTTCREERKVPTRKRKEKRKKKATKRRKKKTGDELSRDRAKDVMEMV